MTAKHESINLHAGLVVCVGASSDDLARLIPTFMHFVPEVPLVVVCDERAAEIAAGIGEDFACSDRLDVRPLIDEEALDYAVVDNVLIHDGYWKPNVLWWKLEALNILTREFPGMGILLMDSDIVFTAPFSEHSFEGVDVVVSPFYWKEPNALVSSAAHDKPVPVALRNGQFNAGLFYTNNSRVAQKWQQLFEAGEGDFYEEGAIQHVLPDFAVAQFTYLQNFGPWRKQEPSPKTQSVHVREVLAESLNNPSIASLKEFANEAVKTATTALKGAPRPFRRRTRKR